MIVRHLYISPDHNFFGHHGKPAGQAPTIEVDSVDLVAGSGIVGDRFFNYKVDYKGQVTFFSLSVFESLCERFQVRTRIPRFSGVTSWFRTPTSTISSIKSLSSKGSALREQKKPSPVTG